MSIFVKHNITVAEKYMVGLKAKAPEAIRKAGLEAADHFLEKLPPYPSPPAPGEFAAKTTRAQQKAFFAQLRAGGWSGRTGELGRSVQVLSGETESLGGDVSVVVGSRLDYARWVIGDETQARLHKERWWTLEGQLDKRADDIVDVFAEALEGWLE
jgi:hypothetical protein